MAINNKLKAFVRYANGKVVAGSMVMQAKKPAVGKWEEVAMYKCCATPSGPFNLQQFLSRMNSCYSQVTSLVPQIVYFSDNNEGYTEYPNYIADGCNDMYDDANMYNTNLTQLYNDIKEDNMDYNLNIPYTHTQDPDGNCPYEIAPMNGFISDGTNYFGAGSQYFTNMYPGMFIIAANGVNVSEFSITGNLGSDGQATDAVYIATAHPGWTAFIKTNDDSAGTDDPSVNHIILVYGNVSGATQLYDDTGAYDDHCVQGLGPQNTTIITAIVASETFALTEQEALAIANKILDVYNDATCVPPQAFRLLYSSDQFPPNGVADPENINDWNDYFELPTYGNPFSSVTVNTQEDGSIWINLYGGSNITLKSNLFDSSGHGIILKALDDAGCIVAFENHCFLYQDQLNQVSFPACTSILDDDDGDYGAFGYCYKLTNINFPVLQSAGTWTFYTTGCTYFNLPELTTVTGEGTFYQEENIGIVEFNLPKLQNVTDGCFEGSYGSTISLPSVTSVTDSPFYGAKSVSLPLVTSISSSYAFSNSYLESVNLPLVTTLGNHTFNGCANLNNVNLPNVTTIGFSTFQNCTSLTNFTIPLLTNISDSCFVGCSSLVEVTSSNLPSATTIGEYSFADCSSLTKVNLPLVTSVGHQAFVNNSLASVGNPSTGVYLPSCTDYGPGCFTNVPLVSVNIPTNVTLGDGCFFVCTQLTTVNLPQVVNIPSACFSECSVLQTINLNSCTNLGGTVGYDSVFYNISGNNITLTIPASRMTCDAGNPDGDIVYLQNNNTVTIVTT